MLKVDKKNVSHYLDIIYYVILAAFIVHVYLDNTTFHIPWPNQYYEILRIVIVGFVIFKFGLNSPFSPKILILNLIFWLVLVLGWNKTGYIFLVEIAFFALGAKGIPFRRIALLYLGISIFILSSAFLGAVFGVIPNYVFYDQSAPKNSFGIIYSTDFSAHLLYTVLVYCYIRGKKICYYECGIIGFLGFLIYIYCRARMNSGALIILSILLVGFKFIDQMEKRKSRKSLQILKDAVQILMASSFGCFSIIMIIMTRYFSDSNFILNKLNNWMSNRLSLGQNGIRNYGITFFGTPFDLVGTDIIRKGSYNFIDSSYVLVMLRYGVLVLLAFLIAFTFVAFKARRSKEEVTLVVLFIVAFQCAIEHHMLELNYNIFILLPFAAWGSQINEEAQLLDEKLGLKKYTLFYKISFSILTLLIWIKRDFIISFFRTLITVLNLFEKERQVLFFAAVVLSLGCVGVLFYLMIYKNKFSKYIICASCIYLMAFVLVSPIIVWKKYSSYQKEVVSGIESLRSGEDKGLVEKDIFVEDIPLYYYQSGANIIPGVPYSALNEKKTVIARTETEQSKLIKMGYMCGKLNSIEYVYTNDETIISNLIKNGIQLHEFYDYKTNVNLKDMSKWNNLPLVGNSLVLSGPGQSLYCGPWSSVYSGQLVVEFELAILDDDSENFSVATACATENKGNKIIAEQEIMKEDFDEQGRMILKLQNKIGDISDLEFKIYVNENVKMRIDSIKYYKVGA